MRHHGSMRTRIVGVVAAIAAAAALAVVAAASSSADGLPSYTNGYAKWPRINAKPFTSTGPLSSAHRGVKNVYASRKKVGKRYPDGTVIVKTIQPSGRTGRPHQVAVMRKANGRWRYDEYELAGSRYRNLGFSQSLCQGCHAQARANDYVFTKK
jgi:Cytochrome P460